MNTDHKNDVLSRALRLKRSSVRLRSGVETCTIIANHKTSETKYKDQSTKTGSAPCALPSAKSIPSTATSKAIPPASFARSNKERKTVRISSSYPKPSSRDTHH